GERGRSCRCRPSRPRASARPRAFDACRSSANNLSEIFDEPNPPPFGGSPCLLVGLILARARRDASTRSRRAAGALPFGVDVGAEVARVEAEVLSELHKGQAVFGLGPYVLV